MDLGEDFWTGADTPPMVDPDQPLAMDDEALQVLADWYSSGSIVIDEVVATTPSIVDATSRQVWPEHFDLGGAVTLSGGEKANMGASPGDAYEPAPYFYLGPWSEARPGDPAYWNAPFGAVLRYEDRDQAAAFLRRGLELLTK